MEQIYPDLHQLICTMSEGDIEFQKQLTVAIYKGLLELKEKYSEGYTEKNDPKIQQIRHKLKPTLMMFELSHVIKELETGKKIIEIEGFDGDNFAVHYQNIVVKLDQAIHRVYLLIQ